VVWSYAIEEDLSILATWKRETKLTHSCENISKKIFAVPDSPSPQFKKFLIQHSPERGRTESLPFTQG